MPCFRLNRAVPSGAGRILKPRRPRISHGHWQKREREKRESVLFLVLGVQDKFSPLLTLEVWPEGLLEVNTDEY